MIRFAIGYQEFFLCFRDQLSAICCHLSAYLPLKYNIYTPQFKTGPHFMRAGDDLEKTY
jgi:hypothetical protein